MSFEDEMSDIKNAEISTNNYIKQPGVEVVVIKKLELSKKEHTGCPYIDITFETTNAEKRSNTTRFYRVREGDTEQVKEIKNKRIKELLTNAGANFTLKAEQILKSAEGKQVKALFKETEYLGYDKDNRNKPMIKTKIEYSFSVKANEDLVGNQSYLRGYLKETDRKKFEGELIKWERDNKESSSSAPNMASSVLDEEEDDFINDLNNNETEDDGLEF